MLATFLHRLRRPGSPGVECAIAARLPRGLGLVLAIVLATLGAVSGAGAAEVAIVISEDGAAYTQAADAVREEVGGRATVLVVRSAAWDPGRQKPDVVIALGTRALQTVLAAPAGTAPVVGTLLPRAAWERITRAARVSDGRVGAVFLDQPPARQLNLVRLMLPGRSRVGLLVGPSSEELVQPLRAAAREARLTLREEPVANAGELFAALTRLLPESDTLLALPDAAVFNAGTLHNVLVTTYRVQQPVFGFSSAYVRAGALAAVYSTPQQVGRQAGEQAVRVLGGGALPPPQWPRQFAVSVNPTVARSLELTVEDEAVLTQKLGRMERE